MTEKQVFTKDNLSALLRLQADALDRGEVLEFEEGKLNSISLLGYVLNLYHISGDRNIQSIVGSITLKTEPKMRVMTAEELNDVFHEFGKDFRFRSSPQGSIRVFPSSHLDYDIDENCEYSTDRGVKWQKCEVEE